MRSTQQFSVTLSHELAKLVRNKVESGEYASESEVIREGLRALQRHERALEDWLREEVATTYDAMKADPTRVRSTAQVRARLASARETIKRAS
jgi:putative addiction module CopG family antidote